uniref:Uncharacterized protein n=1 Tax=Anguilla anguilla TaxID=7936 RepID=A0A0E9WP93_ANGAN
MLWIIGRYTERLNVWNWMNIFVNEYLQSCILYHYALTTTYCRQCKTLPQIFHYSSIVPSNAHLR